MELLHWSAAVAAITVLMAYLLHLALAPDSLARHTHAALRAQWFDVVSAQPGTEILAVQTLRNSVMTATITASTSALGLMGAATLVAPNLHPGSAADTAAWLFTPRVALELTAMALLLLALVVSTLAIRYYNHAGFVCAMPVGSAPRARWGAIGKSHLRQAGVLYSWGLRCMILVAPVRVSIAYAPAGPVARCWWPVYCWGWTTAGSKAWRSILRWTSRAP